MSASGVEGGHAFRGSGQQPSSRPRTHAAERPQLVSGDARTRKLQQLAAQARIEEPCLEVVEGFAGAGAATAELLLGDVVPGLSALTGKRRRIVLVALEHIYLIAGERFGKLGARSGVYEIGPGVIVQDAEKLIFPDGQTVVGLTGHQVGLLARAVQVASLLAASADYLGMGIGDVYAARQAGSSLAELALARGLSEDGLKEALAGVLVDFQTTAAEALMKAAGISDERPLAAERGWAPKAATTVSRLLDATIGHGDLDFREQSEPRLVLVTDRRAYIFEGRNMVRPGALLGRYDVGDPGFAFACAQVTLPDGGLIVLANEAATGRVAAAVSAGCE